MLNHFYFYGFDDDFGPFFLRFCSYFSYTERLCINGNEYVKRHATKARIGFTALDNGFAAVDDVAEVQAICAGRVLADPDARQTGLGADLLRADHQGNLDIGRPDQVSLIFNRQVRRNTPG